MTLTDISAKYANKYAPLNNLIVHQNDVEWNLISNISKWWNPIHCSVKTIKLRKRRNWTLVCLSVRLCIH